MLEKNTLKPRDEHRVSFLSSRTKSWLIAEVLSYQRLEKANLAMNHHYEDAYYMTICYSCKDLVQNWLLIKDTDEVCGPCHSKLIWNFPDR
jgi:hypothetical protein